MDMCPCLSFQLITFFCIPISFLDRKFIVEISVELSTKENSIDIFTDGSKSKVGVGGGIYIPENRKNISFKLLDYCSILQAEYWLLIDQLYGCCSTG